MLRYLIFFLSILAYSTQVFAFVESSIDIDRNSLVRGESTVLKLEVNASEFTWNIDYNIEWLEDFEIFSRGQYFQFENIWWNVQGKMRIQLSLRAVKVWEFTLWPTSIKIWDREHRDETLLSLIVQENNIQDNSIWEDVLSQNTLLYGIIELPQRPFIKILWYIIWILILVLSLFYILTQYKKSNRDTLLSQEDKIVQEQISLYKKYFSDINNTDTSRIFMEKYLKATERYLTESQSEKHNYATLTLEEIMKLHNYNLYSLKDDFKNIYMLYYSGKTLSDEEKNDYISKLKTTYINE
mgnify:CR=1 FL=1